jgi:hypothetical protein
VEDQRFIVNDKILVEGESSWASLDDDRCIDPIDPLRDLMDVCP